MADAHAATTTASSPANRVFIGLPFLLLAGSPHRRAGRGLRLAVAATTTAAVGGRSPHAPGRRATLAVAPPTGAAAPDELAAAGTGDQLLTHHLMNSRNGHVR